MQRSIFSFLFAAALAAGLCFFFFPGSAGVKSRAGSEPAPAWQLPDLNGKTVKLSDFQGKVVVLNLWATWCPPCVEEIPNFIEAQKEYQDRNVVVVGASIDSIAPAEVAAFAKEKGINYPIVMATEEMAAQYDPEGNVPMTFIIDPTGHIVNKHLGILTKDELEAQIRAAL